MQGSSKTKVPDNVDAYIAGFPEAVQAMLESVRVTILKAAPQAKEVIKYAMPTYMQHGNLVYFAGYKAHIGFYGVPEDILTSKDVASKYITSKGTIQFPLDKPVPHSLITKIVKHRAKKDEEAWQLKNQKKNTK